MLAGERRAHFRQGLSTLYLPFYDALCSTLSSSWQPYSAGRDFAAQDFLFAQGRTVAPIGIQHRVTNARGGESAHNYLCGSDWTWFEGETLCWLTKEDPRWKEYVDAVTRTGLRPGAEFGDVDHNELKLSCSWPQVLLHYKQGGMTQAQQHIQANMVYKAPLTQPEGG